MSKLRVLSLFAGIGGFDLGLQRTGGFETVAFCEIDPFCRRVLAKRWPNVRQYDDVRTLTADALERDGIAVDVICGGFPCQDISVAGKRAGIADGTRSGLWSEVTRLAGEIQPQFLILENVANLLAGPSERPGGWFSRVLGDLAELGYDAEWRSVRASELGAPHHRERIWIIAYASQVGRGGPGRDPLWKHEIRIGQEWAPTPFSGWRDVVDWLNAPVQNHLWETTDRESGGVDGRVSRGLDRPDIGALGNAVVPQVVELIGHAILQTLSATNSSPSLIGTGANATLGDTAPVPAFSQEMRRD